MHSFDLCYPSQRGVHCILYTWTNKSAKWGQSSLWRSTYVTGSVAADVCGWQCAEVKFRLQQRLTWRSGTGQLLSSPFMQWLIEDQQTDVSDMTWKSCTVVSHTRSRPISVMAVIVATGQLTILLQHGGKMLIGAMKLWVGIVRCESKKNKALQYCP